MPASLSTPSSQSKTRRPVQLEDFAGIIRELATVCEAIAPKGSLQMPAVSLNTVLSSLAATVGDSVYWQANPEADPTAAPGDLAVSEEAHLILSGGRQTKLSDLPTTSVFGRLVTLAKPHGIQPKNLKPVSHLYETIETKFPETPFGFAPVPTFWPNLVKIEVPPLEMAYLLRGSVVQAADTYNGNKPGTQTLLATHALAWMTASQEARLFPPTQIAHIVAYTVAAIAQTTPITADNRGQAEARLTKSKNAKLFCGL